MFHREIYGILRLRATEFDGNRGGVAIVNEFNFCSMCDDAFDVGEGL